MFEFDQLSVVIPVYNSADCLDELMVRLTDVLGRVVNRYEVILVDDASPDSSWIKIQELQKKYSVVHGIQLMKNSGQPAATLCGLANSKYELIATMDDDLQHQPEDLCRLMRVLLANSELDCVFGFFEEKFHAGYRNFASRIINRINANAYKLPKGVRSSAFRVMRRQVVDAINRQKMSTPAIPVLLFGTTRRVMSVPVTHHPRFSGSSNYSFGKQFRLAFDNICNATLLPLRLITGMGLLICGFSSILAILYLFQYINGQIHVAGWTTVVLLLIFFSGTILITLGVIGEYLGRVLREVSSRPTYLVRQEVGIDPDHDDNGG